MVNSRILADAVVDDTQFETHSSARCGHHHMTWRSAGGNPVPDRVLHERLQHQVRHQRIPRIGIDLERNRESILESDLLDLDVVRQQLELLRERDLLLTCAAE